MDNFTDFLLYVIIFVAGGVFGANFELWLQNYRARRPQQPAEAKRQSDQGRGY